MGGESEVTPIAKKFSFKSPVAAAWSDVDYLAAGAAHGNLVVYSSKEKGGVNRRDVVNNATILGPLIQEVGFLTKLANLFCS